MTVTNLQSAWQMLPADASEAVVAQILSQPLLEALGFQLQEFCSQYLAAKQKVDIAARKTIGDDIFLQTQSNPYLLIELKRRTINLSEGTPDYHKTANQLKEYFLNDKCKTAVWGIISNGNHIQLFRKHGRVIYPATPCLALGSNNVDDVVASIRQKIENPSKALTVAIYNNKGGVGKTTTTVNLAAILALSKKRVLAIDFDPNQQDLTSSLKLPLSEGTVFSALVERDTDIRAAIRTCVFKNRRIELRFDVIPADKELIYITDNGLKQEVHKPGHSLLHRKLESLKQDYDYILIDSPPNWRFFSKLAVYAADVVLIPTKHNNLFSLENAATAIKQFIPEMQVEKGNGGPIPLPIFFNGERITPSQLEMAHQEIDNILKDAKGQGFNLCPYFYPKYTQSQRNRYIPEVPSYAHIAGSAFARIPAVYRDRAALDYYKNLAKEYFLL